MPSENALQLPHFALHRPFTTSFGTLATERLEMNQDLVSWAGFSALTLNSEGYPADAIPLLTCCGDELCGYFACSMVLEGNHVVWRNFGWVNGMWDAKEEHAHLVFKFEPITQQREFIFEREQYQAVLETILRWPGDDVPDQPNRREEKAHRTRLFAAARGFQFPQELRVSLAQALTESDPLNFRRYGEVDPSVYAGISPSFWDTQYKEFQKDPTSCVVRALESTFSHEVSRGAVSSACVLALETNSQVTN